MPSTWRRELLLGLLVGAWAGSLVSGGFVLYLNNIAIGVSADPVAIVVLRVVVVLLVLWLLSNILRRGYALAEYYHAARGSEPGRSFYLLFGVLWFFPGLFLTVYGLGSTVVALVLSYVVAPLLGYICSRTVHKRVWALVGLAMLIALLLTPLHLYEPVASSGHIGVARLSEPISVNGFKRFIPLMTAYVYASDRIQSPVHRIYPGDSYIYYNGSHSVYNWVIEPEGLWNELTRKPLGVVFVYGDVYPPQVVLVKKKLAWGLHNKRFLLLLVDTLERHIVLSCGLRYKPLLEDNMEILYRGHVYILVPLESWDRGLLYSVPVLAGYAVVDESGGIKCIPVTQVKSFPVLESLPLLPEKIARAWAETYRYHAGFTGFYFYHNTYVIRDVGTNPQPYLEQDTRGRQYWVFVAEPAGRTYSAKYIIYVPAGYTGRPRLWLYQLPRPVIGVSKVSSYVKQAHPVFDWSQLSIQEPMPTILNTTLYWKVTVTTKDYRGLVSIDVVNAATGEVESIQPTGRITYLDAMKQLLAGRAKPGKKSIIERINELEKRIDQVTKQLEEMKKELEELKKQLESNETRH